MKDNKQEAYRLTIFVSGKWHLGRVTYTTEKEAQERRKHFISTGTKAKDIKIITDSQLFD